MLTGLAENRIVRFLGSDGVALAFKVAYLLLAFMSFNSLVANLPPVTYAAYAVAAFGLLVLAARVVSYRRFKDMPLLPLLALFAASFVVSAAFSARSGIMENVQGLIWLTLEFFCLYACDVRQPARTLRRDLAVFAAVFVGYTLCASAIGIYMGLANYQDGFEVRYMVRNLLGIFQGRLYGLYSDPNYGAVYGIVSILFGWWLFLARRSRPVCALAVLNTLVQGAYIGLTGSRTGVYGALFTAALVAFLLAMRRLRERNLRGGRGVRALASVLAAAVLVVGVYAGFKGVEQAYLALSPVVERVAPFPLGNDFLESRIHLYESPETQKQKELAQQQEAQAQKAPADAPDASGSVDSAGPSAAGATGASGAAGVQEEAQAREGSAGAPVTQGIGEDKIGLSARVDVDEGDFSNGRFSIWESGLEVFLQSPLIGVSHRHIADFAAEHLPQTYIVQAGYTTMHNVFVDILAGQGIVGLAIMLAFVVLGIRLLARGLLAYRGDGYCRMVLLVGILASVAFSALFYSEILYINTVGSVVFWTTLGYVVVRFRQAEAAALSETGEKGGANE